MQEAAARGADCGEEVQSMRMTEAEFAGLANKPKPRKFRNTPTGKYASKRESQRARELKAMLHGGLISGLIEQKRYEIIPKQRNALGKIERPCVYIADFEYIENSQRVVEDCKGYRTPIYIIKRKLMLFVHGITVRET